MVEPVPWNDTGKDGAPTDVSCGVNGYRRICEYMYDERVKERGRILKGYHLSPEPFCGWVIEIFLGHNSRVPKAAALFAAMRWIYSALPAGRKEIVRRVSCLTKPNSRNEDS